MDAASSFDLRLVWNIFSSIIFPLVTLGVCIYYIARRLSVDGFLIAGGALIHLITSIFYTLIWPSLIENATQPMEHYAALSMIISVISFFGSILYVTGIIILIFNHLSLLKKLKM